MVTITLNLEDDILIALTLYAHEKNITLNQAINDILKEQINIYQKENNL